MLGHNVTDGSPWTARNVCRVYQRVGGDTPHLRHRARVRAVARVVLATTRARALPAETAAEQHRNLVAALEPWLKLIPATDSR